MVTLLKQERSNGDVTSTLLLKNGRASSPTIFSKNFASGSVLSILITDTVYFTLPFLATDKILNVAVPLGLCRSVGVLFFESINISRPGKAPVCSLHRFVELLWRVLWTDQRDHNATLSFLNNASTFQNYLFHHK